MKECLKRLPLGGILLLTTIFLLAFSCASLSKQTVTNIREETEAASPVYSIADQTMIVNVEGMVDEETSPVGYVISKLIDTKKSSENNEFSEIKILEIRINSDGGYVRDAFQICELMEEAKQYVIVKTVAYDSACSAAALILSAGTKGERYVRKDSEVMIHDSWSSIIITFNRRTLDELRDYYESDPIVIKWYKLLSEYTEQTYEKIKDDCYFDTYFTGQGAIDYGLADKIIW